MRVRCSGRTRLTPEGCWLLAVAGDQWHASIRLARTLKGKRHDEARQRGHQGVVRTRRVQGGTQSPVSVDLNEATDGQHATYELSVRLVQWVVSVPYQNALQSFRLATTRNSSDRPKSTLWDGRTRKCRWDRATRLRNAQGRSVCDRRDEPLRHFLSPGIPTVRRIFPLRQRGSLSSLAPQPGPDSYHGVTVES